VIVTAPAPSEDELDALLRDAQRLIFKYPIASQAFIAALAAEGRTFAQTPEGMVWRERLARSELYRKGRELWYLGTLGMFSARSSGVLPSVLIEAFVQAVRTRDIASLVTLLGGPRR
jgi:hypothetical protein